MASELKKPSHIICKKLSKELSKTIGQKTTATINPRMGDGSMPGLQPSLASQIADGRSTVPAVDRHEIERQRRRSVATDTLVVAATRTAETDAARELAVTTRRAAGAAALRHAASGAAPPQA